MKTENIVVNTLVFDEKIRDGIKQHQFLEEINLLGVQKVEVRRDYIKDEIEFDSIRNTAKEFDIEIFYSIPELLFTDNMLEKEKMRTFFLEADRMGATKIKMTGGFAKDIKQEDINFINSLIKDYHIKAFTIENNQVASYSTGENLYQLTKQLRNKGAEISITFDIGNFIYVHEDPIENAKKLKEMVSIIHLKDVKYNTLKLTLLGQGDIPLKDVLDHLPQNIEVVIEYPCGDQPIKTLKKELDKLLSITNSDIY